MFFSYGLKLLHVKRPEKYERNADQLTNLGFGGVSSTCPITGQDGEYWVLNCKKIISHYPCVCRLIIITLCMFELCCFQIRELIKNDLIQ